MKPNNSKPLKVAIYSGAIPSTTFIENLIEALSEKGLNILLFGKVYKHISYSKAVNIFGTPRNRYINVFVTGIRSIHLLVKYPKRFFILKKELKQFNGFSLKWHSWSRRVPVVLHLPDIFHIQWAKDLEFWMFLKERFNCKLVLSLLGSHINYSPIADEELANSYRLNFPKVDAFQAVSDAIALEARQYAADKNKIETIRTILKPSLFELFSEPQKRIKTPLRVVSIGRHHWIKGYEYALAAMAILKDKGINFVYDIIAQGEIPEALFFQRDQMFLTNEVQFLDGLSQVELFKGLKTYDVLLLPSLNEGIANVVLEAMAIGVPVISTNCGGMAEVVLPSQTGWLVPVRDPEAIADTIVEVLQAPETDLQNIAKNAHDFVKKHFNAEDGIQQFLDLYRSVNK